MRAPKTPTERISQLQKKRRKVEKDQDRYERMASLYLTKFRKTIAKIRYYDRGIEKIRKEARSTPSKRVIEL